MGASGSKASRAAGAATRQYPKGPKGPRPPTTTTTQQQAPQPQSQPPPSQTTNAPPQPPPAPNSSTGPTVKPQPHASSSRSEAINLDASDPDFARSLRSLGPVQPNPTLSPSSAFGQPVPSKADNGRGPVVPDPRKNPAIAVLHARERLAVKAEGEERRGRGPGARGREFLDVFELRQVLVSRDVKGMTPREIERKMGLKEGVVGRLGGRGVLGLVREVGREKKGVDIV